jgi:hypothetical protein
MITRLAFAATLLFTGAARADQYDYLLNYPDQPTAQADPVLAPYWSAPSAVNPSGSWDQSRTFQVNVYSQAGGFPGYWIWISEPKMVNTLLTDPALVIAADRDMAAVGNPAFMLYVTPNLSQAQLDAARVSPTPLGSNYPFGNAP